MRQRHKGQSLIEILVATSIIAVVLVGVSDLISRSLSLATFQKNKNEAVSIAQNELNYLRQQRDLAPTEFYANPPSVCEVEFDNIKYDCSLSGDATNMTVTLTWTEGNKTVSTSLSQTLTPPTK